MPASGSPVKASGKELSRRLQQHTEGVMPYQQLPRRHCMQTATIQQCCLVHELITASGHALTVGSGQESQTMPQMQF